MSSVVFARPGAVSPRAGWFHKDLESLKFLHLRLAVIHMKAQRLWLMARVSPTMSPLAMLDRVATTLLLLRLFLLGAVPDTQHTRGSCFMVKMGECWGDFYC